MGASKNTAIHAGVFFDTLSSLFHWRDRGSHRGRNREKLPHSGLHICISPEQHERSRASKAIHLRVSKPICFRSTGEPTAWVTTTYQEATRMPS